MRRIRIKLRRDLTNVGEGLSAERIMMATTVNQGAIVAIVEDDRGREVGLRVGLRVGDFWKTAKQP